jgi:hypothetical protein
VAPPVPYNMINNNTNLSQRFRAGINFAYGGSGALSALGPDYPTLGKQVQQLKNLTDRGIVSKDLVTKSTCLVVVAGNDYSIFLASNPLNSVRLRVLPSMFRCPLWSATSLQIHQAATSLWVPFGGADKHIYSEGGWRDHRPGRSSLSVGI